MEIQNSAIQQEINKIINQTPSSFYTYECVIHYTENDIYIPVKILGITIRRDYVQAYTDEITCSMLIPLGKYNRKIYPNRYKLEISLYKREISTTKKNIPNKKVLIDKYTAILMNLSGDNVTGQGQEHNDEETLDLLDVVVANFQLLPKSIEKIRKIQIGGVYSNFTIDKLLRSLIINGVNTFTIDNKKTISSLDIIDINNTSIIPQLVIPHGTALIDLVSFVQKRIGIYNAGVGNYIQSSVWYIYNLYDVSKFNDINDTATLVILPEKKYSNIEYTYSTDGTKTILVTGSTKFIDDNNIEVMNTGSGNRFTNSDLLSEASSKTTNNRTIISRGKLNTEFTTDNVAQYSPSINNITNNSYEIYSQVNARVGGLFVATWQNVDNTMLRPGMRLRIVYDDLGKLKILYGILVSVDYIYSHIGSIKEERYASNAKLQIFINKIKKG